MSPLDLVKLTSLMRRTAGRREIAVGLIDGPVNRAHPDLAGTPIHEMASKVPVMCARSSSTACIHGTFVAGILFAKRSSSTPGICPDCTLLVRPIFAEGAGDDRDTPSATPADLAGAIVDTIKAGARIINLSAAVLRPSALGARELEQALNFAATRGVITVAATGNQGTIGSSIITRHPWVISVAGCDLNGLPMGESNFGNSIGRRGLLAPARGIAGLGTDGTVSSFGGTSAAAPFVTGTIALLMAEVPSATGASVKLALLANSPRNAVVPPLLNAAAAYQRMVEIHAET